MRRAVVRWALGRWWAPVVLAVLGSPPAGAVSLVTEVTAARPFTALSLMGELELVKDRTFLTGCFSSMRSAPLSLEGTDAQINIPRSNQICLGVDHGMDDHWRGAVMASFTPRVRTQLVLIPQPNALLFRADTASGGASLGLSYDSAGLEEVQWGMDLGLSASVNSLGHEWVSARGNRRFGAMLVTLRPAAGFLLVLGDFQAQLRASYTFYSQDPLSAGAVSDRELEAVYAYFQWRMAQLERYGLTERYATFLQAANRLLAADAISGFASAPVLLELRPSLQYRFARWLRGQVGYTFDRYVEGAGSSHVGSTKWTVTFSEHFQTWVAASLQVDVPGEVPPQRYAILTLGVEVSF